jgi:hypothetical protein
MEPSQNSDMLNFFPWINSLSQLLLRSAPMLLVIEADKSGLHH